MAFLLFVSIPSGSIYSGIFSQILRLQHLVSIPSGSIYSVSSISPRTNQKVSIPSGSIYRQTASERSTFAGLVSIPSGSIYSQEPSHLPAKPFQFQFRQVLFIGIVGNQ